MVARSPCQSLIMFFTTVLEVDSFFFFSCGFIGFLLISFGKVYASRFVVRVGKCWVFFPFFFFLSFSFWLFTSSLPSCSVKRHTVLLCFRIFQDILWWTCLSWKMSKCGERLCCFLTPSSTDDSLWWFLSLCLLFWENIFWGTLLHRDTWNRFNMERKK